MKKVLFLTVAMLLFVSSQNFAQSVGEKSTTVYHYYLNVDQEFQTAVRGANEKVEDLKEMIKGKNPLKEGIIDTVFYKIKTGLETETDYRFLPVDALENETGKKVFYTARDYPMTTKKRAISNNTSEYYAAIDVSIYSRITTSFGSTNLGPYEREKKKLRPAVRIVYTVFDKNGNKVASYKGKAHTKEVVTVKGQTIRNWFNIGEQQRFDDEDNQNVLNKVIDEAIKDLLNKMNVA